MSRHLCVAQNHRRIAKPSYCKVMPKGETTESEQDKSVVVLEKKKHSKKSKDVQQKPRTSDINSKHRNRGKGKLKLTDTDTEEVEHRLRTELILDTEKVNVVKKRKKDRVEERGTGPSKVEKKGKEKMYETDTEGGVLHLLRSEVNVLRDAILLEAQKK
ncbi:hypothetical protein E3N88_43466 [Mikania micrantha]|uniref:Uncharacterized protein n=1 Tax=Mikania micrantha TaxID=192012 RepID=A0A5N6LES2_9ASTR|nr:hypothetical protein E3N88_43466 [Mikania micrantha]